jgi:protein involved in polysaccharide export with SLBB domain
MPQKAPNARIKHRLALPASLLALLLYLMAHAGLAADYTLDSGDVLRISIFGEPAYPLETVVDDRGVITLPLLGEIGARNQTPAALSETIRKAFQDQKLLIDPFVQVEVREYRPFFISGAVTQPGSYLYKPGMTVRHALAIAGGFKALSVDNEISALKIAELRAERASLLIEEFRHRTSLARLHAESRDQESFSIPVDRPMEVAPKLLSDIIAAEQDQLTARRAAFQSELAHLQSSLARARQDAKMLATALAEREKAAKLQLQQLESQRQLQKKGLVANTLVLTAERAQNSYQVDLAEAAVSMARTEQEILNLENELRGKQSTRKLDLVAQIEQEQLELAKIQSTLRYLSDKLLFVSDYGQHRTFEELRSSVKITIYRGRAEDGETIAASETTEVRAGDVIDVSILTSQRYYDVGPASPGN